MTPEEYQKAAWRTINTDLSDEDQLQAQLVGMACEAGEVLSEVKAHLYQGKPIAKEAIALECGDVLWSVANVCTIIGCGLRTVLGMVVTSNCGLLDASLIMLKRGLSCMEDGMLDAISLSGVIDCMTRVLELVGYTLADAMDLNIAKLAKRYPDGFFATSPASGSVIYHGDHEYQPRCSCAGCADIGTRTGQRIPTGDFARTRDDERDT